MYVQGRIQDFKSGGGGGVHLKKLRRAEEGAKILGVFRVKNHYFTTKKYIFYNCGRWRENFGVFRVKNHDFTPKNHIFSNFRGGGGGAPGSAPDVYVHCLRLFLGISLIVFSVENKHDVQE